jgi:hypothetical protein
MSTFANRVQAAPRPAWRLDALSLGLILLGVYHLALAAFMAIAPHAFFTAIGPFGPANDHYIRDTATFNVAFGVGLLLAVRLQSWRVPVLAIVTIQFALHTLNHLLDIGEAHPGWVGYFDFFSLLAATLMLGGLLALARSRRDAPHPRSEGDRP